MFIQIIPDGFFCFVRKDDPQNEFKSNVFQHIVTEIENFDIKKVDELLALVQDLVFVHGQQYKVEFESKIFDFIAFYRPEIK